MRLVVLCRLVFLLPSWVPLPSPPPLGVPLKKTVYFVRPRYPRAPVPPLTCDVCDFLFYFFFLCHPLAVSSLRGHPAQDRPTTSLPNLKGKGAHCAKHDGRPSFPAAFPPSATAIREVGFSLGSFSCLCGLLLGLVWERLAGSFWEPVWGRSGMPFWTFSGARLDGHS